MTLCCENYVNRLCETWTPKWQPNNGRACAYTTSDRTAQKHFTQGTGKLCSKVGENRSINNVTVLSTDAGGTLNTLHRTPDGHRTPDTGHVLSNPIQCICIALHWTDNKEERMAKMTWSESSSMTSSIGASTRLMQR